MSIIAWIVLGAIAGYLAGFLVKGDEGLGVIGHIVLGIVGALVGGFLAGLLFNSKPIDGPLDISTIVVSVIGAVLVVLVASFAMGRSSNRPRRRLAPSLPSDPCRNAAGVVSFPEAHRRQFERSTMSKIEKSIDVNVPVREAYNQWTQFESFPQFMDGVKSVTPGGRHPPALGRRGRRPSPGVDRRDHAADAGPAHRLDVHQR